jgi:hypothetical protein
VGAARGSAPGGGAGAASELAGWQPGGCTSGRRHAEWSSGSLACMELVATALSTISLIVVVVLVTLVVLWLIRHI